MSFEDIDKALNIEATSTKSEIVEIEPIKILITRHTYPLS